MPRRVTDEELALLPLDKQQKILKERERASKTDVKEKRKQSDKRNQDKIKQRSSEYYKKWSSQPEVESHLKEYQKKWREENKERIAAYQKEWHSRPETREKRIEYTEINKERIRDVKRVYNKTEARLKFNKIRSWKVNGFKHSSEEFDVIYERYRTSTECDLCAVPVRDGGNKDRKCADHHHLSGCFRNIVCPKCNSLRYSQDRARMYLFAELHRFFLTR